ncbi:MAG TPA: hypothetical protein VIJ19_00785, partial [Opitutaceae bacterium]
RILSTPVPYQPVALEYLPNANSLIPTAACPGNNVLTYSTTLGTTAAPYQIYIASGINLGSGQTVVINGPTVIVVYGNVTMSGTATIQLRTVGSVAASLAIFAENGTVNINCTGAGGIVNLNTVPVPKNFALLSTSNTSTTDTVALTQAMPFYGVVYFPFLKVTVGSTGASAFICGSIVGSSVTFTNSPIIHYDRALRTPDSTIGDVAFTYLTPPSTVSNFVASVP